MFTLGIDIGSASCKGVLLQDGAACIASAVVQSGTGTSGFSRMMQELFAKADLSPEAVQYTIATGYGRFSVENADKQLSEITCHAAGIFSLCPTARTIIDIGGQDAKAISLDSNGNIVNFFMNDKCAAGTGRFLDVMSRVLEIPLEAMGEEHFKATAPAMVSSTCTVFAESEVISLLSRGVARENILYGVHESVASKACALARRAGVRDDVVMCGGVAQNKGVVERIGNTLGKKVTVAPQPQVTGALGAALLAFRAARVSGDS